MSKRGRKPKPTALHVLRGNPGKRDLNVHEPQHAPLDASDVPDEIATNEIARAEWLRLMPGLSACGQLTVGERGAMIGYCVAWARWRERDAQVAALPSLLVKGSAKQLAVHPLVKLADQALLLFLRAAVEIGLTPSARSRIVTVKPAPPLSKWHGVLK